MRVRAPLVIVAAAILLRLRIGIGFANYDTLYSLVWGQQVARGQNPSYGAKLAPTPHPLLEALGVVLAPLGAKATLAIVVAIAYLALAALGYVVFVLGSRWFSWPVGLAAAAFVLSRYEVLSYGVRAYADVPYVVLVLAALAIESRRRRAGLPVLALLALAGLLRPEAWLFAGVYWCYLWPSRTPRERVLLALAVAAPPVLWVISDAAITGHPLWSLTNTRATAKTLKRATGILNVPYYGARRLGEVLGPDGLAAAAIGGILSLWLARDRARLGAVAGLLAVVALAIVAAAGLPIQDRYVFLAAAILTVFAGAGLAGGFALPASDPHRRVWRVASVLCAIAVLASLPWQIPRFNKTFSSPRPSDQSLSAQQRVASDLVALTPRIGTRCLPIAVPYSTPVPLLALYLHVSPTQIQVRRISHGTIAIPATHAAYVEYLLDKNDLQVSLAPVPAGFHLAARNRSWLVYSSC